MINPVMIDDTIDIIKFVRERIATTQQMLFLDVTYNRNTRNVNYATFIIEPSSGFESGWDLKFAASNFTKETALDMISQEYPDYLDWFLFNPDRL